MGKAKRILTNWRVIILIITLVLAIIAIRPTPWADGVVIKAVERNSTASLAGIESPNPQAQPLSKERVLAINNNPVSTVKDYFDIIQDFEINDTVQIRTTERIYSMVVAPEIIRVPVQNETELITIQETVLLNETINGTVTEVNKTINFTREVPKIVEQILGPDDIGLTVGETPYTNLRKGLDLQGGTRVILQPAEPIDEETLGLVIDTLQQRLNVFGLSDVLVTTVGGIGEESPLILVEIAGTTAQEISDLVQKQGKFEAKVAETTVFKGGGNDITYVCRTADCSGLDPQRGCGTNQGGWLCQFQFSVSLSPAAANKLADATRDSEIIGTAGDRYLADPLDFYLDDELVRSLNIGASLKGQVTTEVGVSGIGIGITQQDALNNMFIEQKTLQTVLVTGSLPVKLEIQKIDTISPILGSAFVKNALLLAGISALAVAIILTLIYRRLKIAIPIILTAVFEITIVLGIAAVIGWNLDLASIAGIIIAIGTGVNDQIIITDEAFRKETQGLGNWKTRMKRAFSIIFASYLTGLVAMIALWFFGAGLLKGFALTTVLAITAGVFITRPAYAIVVNMLTEE